MNFARVYLRTASGVAKGGEAIIDEVTKEIREVKYGPESKATSEAWYCLNAPFIKLITYFRNPETREITRVESAQKSIADIESRGFDVVDLKKDGKIVRDVKTLEQLYDHIDGLAGKGSIVKETKPIVKKSKKKSKKKVKK